MKIIEILEEVLGMMNEFTYTQNEDRPSNSFFNAELNEDGFILAYSTKRGDLVAVVQMLNGDVKAVSLENIRFISEKSHSLESTQIADMQRQIDEYNINRQSAISEIPPEYWQRSSGTVHVAIRLMKQDIDKLTALRDTIGKMWPDSIENQLEDNDE